MTHLIDKSALVAEIENRIKETESMQPKFDQFWAGQISAFKGVLKLLDTLEVKDLPIWERVSPDTGQTTLYKDGGKSYLERFGYRIDLKDLDKLPKKNLKAQKEDSMTDKEKKRLHDIQNVPVDEEKLKKDRRNTV